MNYGFDVVQSTLAGIPDEVQEVAKYILTKIVLDLQGSDAEHPLQYYMDSCGDLAGDEVRAASYAWDLMYDSGGEVRFCALTGWPGDNESGAGVIWRAGNPADKVVVYTNVDGALSSKLYPDAVRELETMLSDLESGG